MVNHMKSSSVFVASIFLGGIAVSVVPTLAESDPPESDEIVIQNFDQPEEAGDTDDAADVDENADDQGADNDDQGADNNDQGDDSDNQGGDSGSDNGGGSDGDSQD